MRGFIFCVFAFLSEAFKVYAVWSSTRAIVASLHSCMVFREHLRTYPISQQIVPDVNDNFHVKALFL